MTDIYQLPRRWKFDKPNTEGERIMTTAEHLLSLTSQMASSMLKDAMPETAAKRARICMAQLLGVQDISFDFREGSTASIVVKVQRK